MKVPLTLNGEQQIWEIDNRDILVDVLRQKKLLSVKCGCGTLNCGACTVLMDGRAVLSCVIPAVAVKDSTVETLEYCLKTPLCSVILDAFAKVNIQLCGYCNAGKILTAYSLINLYQRPSRQLIYDYVKEFNCLCTETDILIQGIILAANTYWSQRGRELHYGNF